MLDVLADTYRIATRTDTFEAPWPAPARRTVAYTQDRRTPWMWQALAWIGARYAAWRDRARAREAVLRMSEHQLNDIGISRHDLLRSIDERR